MKKVWILVLCAVILSFNNLAVCSVSGKITVLKGGVNIVVDGKLLEPKDVNGNIVEPFIYEGTTYLPVRATAEAFGLTAQWHESLRLVSLEEVPVEAEEGTSDNSENSSMEETQSMIKKQSFSEEIEITTGIIIMLNDIEIELKDVNGNPVDVFLSEGTTYLPVRAIANALNVAVFWRDDIGTVYLGDMSNIGSTVEGEVE